jgi:hypothetical protein
MFYKIGPSLKGKRLSEVTVNENDMLDEQVSML